MVQGVASGSGGHPAQLQPNARVLGLTFVITLPTAILFGLFLSTGPND